MKQYIRFDRKKVCIFLACLLCIELFYGSYASAKAKEMSIYLNRKKVTVLVGKKVKLKADICNQKKNAKLIFRSSNKKIAGVTQTGVIVGKKEGKANIKVSIKGKKITAVCVVTVKKAATPNSTIEPTKAPQENEKPDDNSGLDKPVESEKPDDNSGSDKPTESSRPDENIGSDKPTESEKPDDNSGSDKPSENEKTDSAITAVLQEENQTIYIVNRDYEGPITVNFAGRELSTNGKVSELLASAQSLYTTRTNSDKTITVSREYPQSAWTVTDLNSMTKTYITISSYYSGDAAYKNCGAVYVQTEPIVK